MKLFGFMYITGVTLNTTSMICLTMFTGSAVDYSANIAHAVIASKKNPVAKGVVDVLQSLGARVLMVGKSFLQLIFSFV